MTLGGERTEYLIDPSGIGNVVGEYDPSGNVLARYSHGLGLVSRSNSAIEFAFFDFDAIGSTAGISGQDGSYLSRYSYSPFGEMTSSVAGIANPFQYIGQFGVMTGEDTALYMRARVYHPTQGRFTSVDPLGISGDGIALYAYAHNDPVRFFDPAGLKSWIDNIGKWGDEVADTIYKWVDVYRGPDGDPETDRYRGEHFETGDEFEAQRGPIDMKHFEAARKVAKALNPTKTRPGAVIAY